MAEPFIHLVDDDEPVRIAHATLLRREGLTVRTYGHAAEFLRSWDRGDPGCIVSELRVPGLTGLTLQTIVAKSIPFRSCLSLDRRT